MLAKFIRLTVTRLPVPTPSCTPSAVYTLLAPTAHTGYRDFCICLQIGCSNRLKQEGDGVARVCPRCHNASVYATKSTKCLEVSPARRILPASALFRTCAPCTLLYVDLLHPTRSTRKRSSLALYNLSSVLSLPLTRSQSLQLADSLEPRGTEWQSSQNGPPPPMVQQGYAAPQQQQSYGPNPGMGYRELREEGWDDGRGS
jgi:hypothetical protein